MWWLPCIRSIMKAHFIGYRISVLNENDKTRALLRQVVPTKLCKEFDMAIIAEVPRNQGSLRIALGSQGNYRWVFHRYIAPNHIAVEIDSNTALTTKQLVAFEKYLFPDGIPSDLRVKPDYLEDSVGQVISENWAAKRHWSHGLN